MQVASGQALCPLAYETVLETASCHDTKRVALADLFSKISGGWKIKCFDELIIEEMIHLVRRQPIRLLSRYDNLVPVEQDHTVHVRRTFEDAKSVMEARVLAFQYQPEQLGRSVEEIRKSTSLDRAGLFYRDIEKLLAGQTEGLEIPGIGEDLSRAKFTLQELAELSEHILHHRLDAIRLNNVEILIGSQWDFEMTRQRQQPRKYKFNDEIDRLRAAVAITYCDILITDSGAAELAQTAIRDIRSEFPCQIFSVRQVSEIESAIGAL
jgi:hypothetical protein